NDDGTFRIEDVGPDLYNLNIFGLPDGFYLKAVRSGEADLLASGLDVTAGQPAPLQVVLSPHAGQLTGAVQNPATSQPAPGATVVLIPQEKDRRDDGSVRLLIKDLGQPNGLAFSPDGKRLYVD